MRRRLALAILLTVWAVLIGGGAVVYVGIRSILISDLDSVLYARATALPELLQPAGFDESRVPLYDWHDRYLIQQAAREDSPAAATAATPAAITPPHLLGARFTRDAQGKRWRT